MDSSVSEDDLIYFNGKDDSNDIDKTYFDLWDKKHMSRYAFHTPMKSDFDVNSDEENKSNNKAYHQLI